MKVLVYTLAAAIFFGLTMAGWSIGGKLMSAPDSISAAKGFLILATLVGVGAGGAALLVRKALPSSDEPRSRNESRHGKNDE